MYTSASWLNRTGPRTGISLRPGIRMGENPAAVLPTMALPRNPVNPVPRRVRASPLTI